MKVKSAVNLYRTKCKSCEQEFYEYRYSSLARCPHCDIRLTVRDTLVQQRPSAVVELDVFTGELNIIKIKVR